MSEHTPTVVIEQTAKKWKALQAIGVLLSVIGCVGCIAAATTIDHPAPFVVAAVVVAIGLGVYSVARTIAWWHHG